MRTLGCGHVGARRRNPLARARGSARRGLSPKREAAIRRGGPGDCRAERAAPNNRPLYCALDNTGVVLAGDRPFVRFVVKPYVFGGFSAAIVRGDKGKWFHECSEVESRYRCGRMTWRIADSTLPDVEVTLDVVPLKSAAGFALRLSAEDNSRATSWCGPSAAPRRSLRAGDLGPDHARESQDVQDGRSPSSLRNTSWAWSPISAAATAC